MLRVLIMLGEKFGLAFNYRLHNDRNRRLEVYEHQQKYL